MNTQINRKASTAKKTGESMNLLALLFFMMGAVHVYGHLQGSDNQVTTDTNADSISLVKVGLFAMFIAGVIEFLVF